jgi:hypothetical protein
MKSKADPRRNTKENEIIKKNIREGREGKTE